MRLITLNTWSGILRDSLLTFFDRHRLVDIFCLQEVYREADGKVSEEERIRYATDLFGDIKKVLNRHDGYFRPSIGDSYGLSIFVSRAINVVEDGNLWVYRNPLWNGGPDHSRNLQYLVCNVKGREILVGNFHGLWEARGKTDSEDRLKQSARIIRFLNRRREDSIVCGDFNLMPNTRSVKILESKLRNLISESRINSTRTHFYPKIEKLADYIFISSGIRVTEFGVMADVVSDHSALLLDFE